MHSLLWTGVLVSIFLVQVYSNLQRAAHQKKYGKSEVVEHTSKLSFSLFFALLNLILYASWFFEANFLLPYQLGFSEQLFNNLGKKNS